MNIRFYTIVKRRSYPVKTIALMVHAAVVLAISYAIVSCFVLSTKSLSFFSVLDESGDVPMSDMYLFINSRKGPARLDTSITLVCIDECKDRFEIAQVIEQIDAMQPKVIGLDVFFRNLKEPAADRMLENTLRKTRNLVISCILEDELSEGSDQYHIRNRNFFVADEDAVFTEGFVNLDGDGFSTVRSFTPTLFWQKDTLYSFAVQIVRLCDNASFQKLLQRSGNLEVINFQPLVFQSLNKNEISENPELITGKIVLIGSLSEDLHKTPINPQMHGMEIHAHTISTILEEKYIDRLDNAWTKGLNLLLCYLFSLFCWIATTRIKRGVGILVKLAQVAILLSAFFAGYFLFKHYRIDLTYTRSIIVMGVLILIADIYNICIALLFQKTSNS